MLTSSSVGCRVAICCVRLYFRELCFGNSGVVYKSERSFESSRILTFARLESIPILKPIWWKELMNFTPNDRNTVVWSLLFFLSRRWANVTGWEFARNTLRPRVAFLDVALYLNVHSTTLTSIDRFWKTTNWYILPIRSQNHCYYISVKRWMFSQMFPNLGATILSGLSSCIVDFASFPSTHFSSSVDMALLTKAP